MNQRNPATPHPSDPTKRTIDVYPYPLSIGAERLKFQVDAGTGAKSPFSRKPPFVRPLNVFAFSNYSMGFLSSQERAVLLTHIINNLRMSWFEKYKQTSRRKREMGYQTAPQGK